MEKENKLFTLEQEIKEIMIENLMAREDDMYLYYLYCEKVFHKNEKVFTDVFFARVFINKNFRIENGVRTFAGVERCARKIRRNCPELARKFDMSDEKETYKEYSKE